MSLKKDTACPHCEGRVVAHIKTMKYDKRDPLPVVVDDDWMGHPIGHFEAFICKKCGFTEWYARDVEELVRSNEHLGIEILDGRKGPGHRT